MAFLTATPARRQLAMTALLALAVCGALIRHYAPAPSTLHDIGTLLLVLWLPAVGNLIAWLIRRIPRRAPPVIDFADAVGFAPQLRARLQPVDLRPEAQAALAAADRRCTLVVGRSGFTARVAEPVARVLPALPRELGLELLHPQVALTALQPGTAFHLVVGTTAVASGTVLAQAQDGAG